MEQRENCQIWLEDLDTMSHQVKLIKNSWMLSMELNNSTRMLTWDHKPTNGKRKASKKPNQTGKLGSKTNAHAMKNPIATMTMVNKMANYLASANHVEDTHHQIPATMTAFHKKEPMIA